MQTAQRHKKQSYRIVIDLPAFPARRIARQSAVDAQAQWAKIMRRWFDNEASFPPSHVARESTGDAQPRRLKKQQKKLGAVKLALRRLWGNDGPPESMDEKTQMQHVEAEVRKYGDTSFSCSRSTYLRARKAIYGR